MPPVEPEALLPFDDARKQLLESQVQQPKQD
jgi:hypothetical protein